MPKYRACGVTAELGTCNLLDTLSTGNLASGGNGVSDVRRIQGHFERAHPLTERQIDGEGVIRFIGSSSDLPFFPVEASKCAEPLSPPQRNEPEALVLTIQLDHKAFLSDDAPYKGKDLKIEIFVNGTLTAVDYINKRRHASYQMQYQTFFAGKRNGLQAEIPIIYRRMKGAESFVYAADARWTAVALALAQEGQARGVNKFGLLAPSADFLIGLSKMGLPGRHKEEHNFGIIDVVITAGTGKKIGTGCGQMKEPTRMYDHMYRHSNPDAVEQSDLTAVCTSTSQSSKNGLEPDGQPPITDAARSSPAVKKSPRPSNCNDFNTPYLSSLFNIDPQSILNTPKTPQSVRQTQTRPDVRRTLHFSPISSGKQESKGENSFQPTGQPNEFGLDGHAHKSHKRQASEDDLGRMRTKRRRRNKSFAQIRNTYNSSLLPSPSKISRAISEPPLRAAESNGLHSPLASRQGLPISNGCSRRVFSFEGQAYRGTSWKASLADRSSSRKALTSLSANSRQGVAAEDSTPNPEKPDAFEETDVGLRSPGSPLADRGQRKSIETMESNLGSTNTQSAHVAVPVYLGNEETGEGPHHRSEIRSPCEGSCVSFGEGAEMTRQIGKRQAGHFSEDELLVGMRFIVI